MMFLRDGERQFRNCLTRKRNEKAIVIEPEDIKKILAEKYNVPEKNIIKSQYSYTVILDDADDN